MSSAPNRRSARDLAPSGPFAVLDRAFTLARGGGLAVWGPAWLGGGLLAATILVVFYVERVEGVTTLRAPLALALVAAFGARALLLGRSARRVTEDIWELDTDPQAGRFVDVFRTSMVLGLGLWVWAWLLVVGSFAGPVGVLLALPLFALRGGVAPSWIASAACSTRAGWRGLWSAVGDSSGQRVSGVMTEAALLLGAVGLMLNLFGVVVFAVFLMRSLGGMELSALESFVSPDNTFVLLSLAALTLVLMEPLRAAHSAVTYVAARVREEGLDLRVSVERAVLHSGPSRGAGHARAAALLLFIASGTGATVSAADAYAQAPQGWDEQELLDGDQVLIGAPGGDPASDDPSGGTNPGVIPPFEISREDLATQDEVDRILARPEFREFEDDRGAGLRDLIERAFSWLMRPRQELPHLRGPRLPRIPLPGAWAFVLIGGLLLLGVALYLILTRRQAAAIAEEATALAAVSEDIRDRAPSSLLEEAATLAEQGHLRDALRALYLATLVALDRRRWIAFDPHLTNWQYLRQMPRGPVRDAFRSFTRLFDRKWYGEQATTSADYERCRALASEIVDEGRST